MKYKPGGSPLNVAVGLQRLGIPTTLHSAFGADPHGVAIAQHLEESGVTVTPGTVSDRETSVARATIAPDGSATYSFSIAWDPGPADTSGFALVHTGSIGAALEPGATEVERLRARHPDLIVTASIGKPPHLAMHQLPAGLGAAQCHVYSYGVLDALQSRVDIRSEGSDDFPNAELRALLERAVDRLPDGSREVFVLRDVEGLSTAETADILGIREDAVKTRLSRARHAIRRDLLQAVGNVDAQLFSFHRSRCDRVVAAVLARIA